MTSAYSYKPDRQSLPSQEGKAVTLEEILTARDSRAVRQQNMQAQGGVLISLTLAIAGAVKRNPMFDAIFAMAQQAIAQLVGMSLAYSVSVDAAGHHALWLVEGDAADWKQKMMTLEMQSPIARLWDIDVIAHDGHALSRTDFSMPSRRCLLCDDDAKVCARERRHTIEDLHADIKRRYWLSQQANAIGERMRQALVSEATLTPKAGLVDAVGNGGHHDMTLTLFLDSATAIAPYLADCAARGMTFAGMKASPAMLDAVRPIGLAAEEAMYVTTRGINTHKGAIFAFGIFAAALGKVMAEAGRAGLDSVLSVVCTICSELVTEMNAGESAGQRAYSLYGIGGARAEAASGFATVVQHALPHYWHEQGADRNERRALLVVLVALYAHNNDTTTIARVGIEGLRAHQHWARALLQERCVLDDENRLAMQLAVYARECALHRLSAGGSADLLALTIFIGRHFSAEAITTADNPFFHPLI
ncbi:MAG: citrate lyase holo-[acyl-carrier protein] synthase [Cardiobacteriaceae bacterium]|nr:citrate lyase holo-[acyl-carrier protein] synthase [Cardiobacteriaceae bacterium]